MNWIDRQLQPDSRLRFLLGLALTVFLVLAALALPETRYVSLFLALLGGVGVWSAYLSRRRASPRSVK